MDFTSHVLIGILIGIIFSLNAPQLSFLIIGSILPDLFVLPIYFYYKDSSKKSVYEIFKSGKKKKPEKLFMIYDSAHSILLLVILFAISYYFPLIMFLAIGVLIHIIVDLPLHKKHSPGIFFPFKKRIYGFADWYDIYGKMKHRIIVWSILIILIIVAYLLKA
jgi:hypothetical protein